MVLSLTTGFGSGVPRKPVRRLVPDPFRRRVPVWQQQPAQKPTWDNNGDIPGSPWNNGTGLPWTDGFNTGDGLWPWNTGTGDGANDPRVAILLGGGSSTGTATPGPIPDPLGNLVKDLISEAADLAEEWMGLAQSTDPADIALAGQIADQELEDLEIIADFQAIIDMHDPAPYEFGSGSETGAYVTGTLSSFGGGRPRDLDVGGIGIVSSAQFRAEQSIRGGGSDPRDSEFGGTGGGEGPPINPGDPPDIWSHGL